MLANSYCYELLSPSISTKYLFIKFEQLLVSKLHTNSVLLLTSKNKSRLHSSHILPTSPSFMPNSNSAFGSFIFVRLDCAIWRFSLHFTSSSYYITPQFKNREMINILNYVCGTISCVSTCFG